MISDELDLRTGVAFVVNAEGNEVADYLGLTRDTMAALADARLVHVSHVPGRRYRDTWEREKLVYTFCVYDEKEYPPVDIYPYNIWIRKGDPLSRVVLVDYPPDAGCSGRMDPPDPAHLFWAPPHFGFGFTVSQLDAAKERLSDIACAALEEDDRMRMRNNTDEAASADSGYWQIEADRLGF